MSSGITETLPLTVFDVKGPIFIGESPALKFMGKVKWDSPFLKQVTDEGIGVAVTNNSLPGYLGIMATRHVQFCCIFAVTKDKFDYF